MRKGDERVGRHARNYIVNKMQIERLAANLELKSILTFYDDSQKLSQLIRPVACIFYCIYSSFQLHCPNIGKRGIGTNA